MPAGAGETTTVVPPEPAGAVTVNAAEYCRPLLNPRAEAVYVPTGNVDGTPLVAWMAPEVSATTVPGPSVEPLGVMIQTEMASPALNPPAVTRKLNEISLKPD